MAHLVVGCGYLGRRVARLWRSQGDEVVAVTRSPQRADELRREGFRPVLADVTRPETLDALPPAETVLFAVGYDRQSGLARRRVHVDGLAAVLDRLDPAPSRVIFISTTGVIGDSQGAWVDEDSPCRPQRGAGQAFCEAEHMLLAHPLGSRSVILRMAGIYGPGRIPRLADVLAGNTLEVAAGNCVNLIHADDAARVVLAAQRHASPPRIYLVSDGQPVDRREFYRYLARLVGAPPPKFASPAGERVSQRHDAANKRVSNQRMQCELGVKLAYPSYREGLAAIAQEESARRRAEESG